ncbi:hypothetical protein JCM8202v2_002698 [Rhodotorula sphaerocarpa]
MATPYLADTLASLQQSAGVLRSLSFSSRATLPNCVLAPDDWFETHLIRDAATVEQALFAPNPASYPVVQLEPDDPLLAAPDDYEANRLAVARRNAPKRAKVAQTALREQAPTPGRGSGGISGARPVDPERTMPRAQEHVQALHSQLLGLMDSIAATEEALRQPPPRTAPQPQHDQTYYRQLELEDEIKREKLELFALEQIKAEKQAEVQAQAKRRAATAASTSETKPSRPRPSVPNSEAARTNAPAARRRSSAAGTTLNRRASGPRASVPSAAPPAPAPAPEPVAAVAAAVPASPARRPIGRPSVPSVQSAMKRRVEAARARVQASAQATPNRERAFGRASTGGAAGGGGGGEEEEEEEEGQREGEATPRAAGRAPASETDPRPEPPSAADPPVPAGTTAAAASANAPELEPEPALPAGVSVGELESANRTVWGTVGESHGLARWAAKWAREGEGARKQQLEGEEGQRREWGWRETIDILNFAVRESAAAASLRRAGADGPASPSAQSSTSFATSTTTGGGDDAGPPVPWTPAQVVEARLCYLLLATFAGRGQQVPNAGTETDLPPLHVILRETAIPLGGGSTTGPGTGTGLSSRKTPHLSMSSLKQHLGRFAARERGWTEEMGTTAIYALVSRQTVKIDRRGREGAAVGFKAGEW